MGIGRFILALVLILLGVMAFLINIGYAGWLSFRAIAQLWPALLIIIGLSLFWEGQISRGLAYILTVAASIAVVVYMMSNARVFPF